MRKALLQLHLAVFLWGFTGVLGETIHLKAVWLVWYRLLITVISLWTLYALTGRIRRVPMRSVLFMGFIGFILALHWVCFYGSIKASSVTIALTCLSTTALLASFLEPIIIGRKFDWVEVALGLFAVAGITVIYFTHLNYSAGIFIGLLSAVLTVLVSVTTKKVIDRYEPEAITIYQLTGGFLGLTVLLPFYQHFFPDKQTVPTSGDWIWLVVLAWGCTILTFFLYVRALKKVSAFTMNLVLTLEPVYGIVLAFAIYHENRYLNPWFYVGFFLISVAVIFHTWRMLRPKPAPEVLTEG
jgi:drug/metabolite transporter (DMT)-like permease